MTRRRKTGKSVAAERTKRVLEHGATALGAQVTRSLHGGWQRMSPSRRAKLERLAANVTERASDPPAANAAPANTPAPAASAAPTRNGAPAGHDSDVSDVEVRDLRADLARQLEQLANANIHAARGPGVAGEAASADGQA